MKQRGIAVCEASAQPHGGRRRNKSPLRKQMQLVNKPFNLEFSLEIIQKWVEKGQNAAMVYLVSFDFFTE